MAGLTTNLFAPRVVDTRAVALRRSWVFQDVDGGFLVETWPVIRPSGTGVAVAAAHFHGDWCPITLVVAGEDVVFVPASRVITG